MSELNQLVILLVVLPLLAAPLCILLNHARLAWLTALAATLFSLYAAFQLLGQVSDGGFISYALGGWAAPWGIEFRIDSLGAYMLLLVSGIASLTLVYAPQSVQQEISSDKQSGFYAAFLLALAGLLGMTATGDAFNVFVFLEISSLASYALISLGKDRRAVNAAFQYLIMGTIGATFILIGIGFLYMMTGTLNMADLAQRLPALNHTSTVQTGFAFITVGILLKLAMFPLHLWLPNAYAYAPSVVSIFLAATATKVAIYLLIRFVFSVFNPGFAFEQLALTYIVLPLAIVAVLSASLVAIFQDNLKRMLAYSSVAQIGYILIGFALVSATGLQAALLHVFNHALMKGALFMALGAMAWHLGTVKLSNIAGLGKQMPLTMLAFVIGGMSLIGLPLTAGFISKWYLILAAMQQGWWWLVIVILIGSLMAAVYVWRVVETAYFKPANHTQNIKEAPLGLLIPTWILVLANVYFGLETSLTVDVTEQAAKTLFGGGA
jgi:multicomponent Na+:H+ antiporter subunit D